MATRISIFQVGLDGNAVMLKKPLGNHYYFNSLWLKYSLAYSLIRYLSTTRFVVPAFGGQMSSLHFDQNHPFEVLPLRKGHRHRMVWRASHAFGDVSIHTRIQACPCDDLVKQIGADAA